MSDQGVSLERLKERLDREPCVGAIHLLAETYYQQGQYPQAAEASRRGLALNPENVELRLILGQSLAALGDLPAAEEALKAVAREISRLGEVFDTLGRVYGQQARESLQEQAAQLYRLLQEPLHRLLRGEELPAAPQAPPAPPQVAHRRLLLTKTLMALEQWQRALQLQYQEG